MNLNLMDKINQELHNNGVPQQKRLETIKDVLFGDTSNSKLEEATMMTMKQMLDHPGYPDFLQHLFMSFAEKHSKVSLNQYYTPSTIGQFIANCIDQNARPTVLDPACGTGELAINIKSSHTVYKDISKEACELLEMNLSLRNRATSFDIHNTNSLCSTSSSYDIVVINPPFGTKTLETSRDILDNFSISKNKPKEQVCKLFIEYGLRHLNPSGLLFVILPLGYLTNTTETDIRQYIMASFRLVAVIELPANTFKRSGTGVDTCMLIIQNAMPVADYQILAHKLSKIGINAKYKHAPPLYKSDGTLDNDFDNLLPQLACFASKHNIFLLNKDAPTSTIDYDYLTRDDIMQHDDVSFGIKQYTKEYRQTVARLRSKPHFTLDTVTERFSIAKKEKHPEQIYTYLDISEISDGCYKANNRMQGRDLPERATYEVQEQDILLSRLEKRIFCMVQGDAKHIIATNGLFVIRIPEEHKRLSFYTFLHTRDFLVQYNALARGSIMAEVRENDLLTKLIVPTYPDETLERTSVMLASYKAYHLMRMHAYKELV